MSIAVVKEYLSQNGFAGRVREFDVSSATVSLAAQALGCEEAHIAKQETWWQRQFKIRWRRTEQSMCGFLWSIFRKKRF